MSEIDDMKNRRITIGKGRTISIAKFESRRIDVSVMGDIPDKADIDEFVDDISVYCNNWLDEEESKILKEAVEE